MSRDEMGSHFHDWIDYNGFAFSIELLEWGPTFSDFGGEKVLHIYGSQTHQNACTVDRVKSKVIFIQFKENGSIKFSMTY